MSTHDPIADSLLVHGNFVRRLAQALAGADADDLVQATWTAALQADRAAVRNPRAWLGTIVNNLARNFARGERRRRHHQEAAATRAAHGPDVAEILAREEARRQVVAEVVALPEPLRTVVLLHFFEGLDSGTIGARLGTPASTVRSQLQRALTQLRSRLDSNHGGERAAWALPLLAAPQPTAAASLPTAMVLLRAVWTVRTTLAVAALLLLSWWILPLLTPAPSGPSTPPVMIADGAPATDERATTTGTEPERVAVAQAESPTTAARTPEQLWGRVVDDVTGAPVAGAEVRLEHRDADEMTNLDLEHGKRVEVIGSTRTDDRGAFEFRVRRALQHRLAVRAGGYAPLTEAQCTGGSEFELRLQRPATITGTVRSAVGRPLADVQVFTFVRSGTGERVTTQSQADGTFSLTGLPPGDSYVTAVPAGCMETNWQRVTLTAGTATTVEIEVADGRTAHGTVLDADTGLPIAGARISTNWTFRHGVTSAADGSFALGAVGEFDQLYVRADGYADQIRAVPSGQEPPPFEFRLQRGDTLLGRIVDAKGRGLADAYVAAGVNDRSRAGGRSSTFWCAGSIDDTGRFRIERLSRDDAGRPRAWQLLVRAPGMGTRVLALPSERLVEGVLDVGDVRLAAQGILEGRAVDGDGKPLAGVEINLRGTPDDARELVPDRQEFDAMYHFAARSARTASDGMFRIAGLGAGEYSLLATPRGVTWEVESGPHVVAAGRITTLPDLVADAGLTIRGHVRIAGDQALLADGAVMLSASGPGQIRQSRVAPDGTFVIERLERGEFVLAGLDVPTGYAVVPRTGIAAGSTDVELELALATTLEGTVVDADGKPVPRATVYFFPTGVSRARNVRADAEGRFRIDVPPGVVGNLGASHPDAPMCQTSLENVATGTVGLVMRLPTERLRR